MTVGADLWFGTKAETLVRLTGRLDSGSVLPLSFCRVGEWRADPPAARRRLIGHERWKGPFIVRSSALVEDGRLWSGAGRFASVGPVSADGLADAVATVLESYGPDADDDDQLLVQEWIDDAVLSGVASSCHPTTGAPYSVVSWTADERIDTVTSGGPGDLHVWYLPADDDAPAAAAPAPRLERVVLLLREVMAVTGQDQIEIEFAMRSSGQLVLLQARRLARRGMPVSLEVHRRARAKARRDISAALTWIGAPAQTALFGVMPDWNPAEIIGIRPRRLASSLYERLVTDAIWARARVRYGYRDMRGRRLMLDFAGHPYIDVRGSLCSLLPAALPDTIANAVVTAQIERLRRQPDLHDKVELEVAISCPRFGEDPRLDALAGVPAASRARLQDELAELVRWLVGGVETWRADLALLEQHRDGDRSIPATPAGIAAAVSRCTERGALPFAGLARAAFVASDLLRSLVAAGALAEDERTELLRSMETVAARLAADFHVLERDDFLCRYGHVRPGTYDIASPRYDHDPSRYFSWGRRSPLPPPAVGLPSPAALARIDALLTEQGWSLDGQATLDFVVAAIRGREEAKLDFTRTLSDVLEGIAELGETYGVGRSDLAHIDLGCFERLDREPRGRRREVLMRAAERGRAAHELAQLVELPVLVEGPGAVDGHEALATQPSFVTLGTVVAPPVWLPERSWSPGCIAVIDSADPGYDWLFTQDVRGLVTAYGGVNSHMAIRALELGIPAAIGVGEERVRQWAEVPLLEIDAAHRTVRILP